MKTFHASLAAALLLSGFGMPAAGQTLPLPQGLSCGMSYIDSDLNELIIGEVSKCNGSAPIFMPFEQNTVQDTIPVTGYVIVHHGDIGNSNGTGYVNEELVDGVTRLTIPAVDTTRFTLPMGAVCGFHHTENSPGRTCMGFQPSKDFNLPEAGAGAGPGPKGCPDGWIARKAYDSSSDAWFWVWCEYQDPHGLSGGAIVPGGTTGVTCGMSSNVASDDPEAMGHGLNGGCMGNNTVGGSPGTGHTYCPGMQSSLFYNSGDSDGVGVGFCSTLPNAQTNDALPPIAFPPVRRQAEFPPPPPDCNDTGCSGAANTCCQCTAVPTCMTASACNRVCHE